MRTTKFAAEIGALSLELWIYDPRADRGRETSPSAPRGFAAAAGGREGSGGCGKGEDERERAHQHGSSWDSFSSPES